MRAVLSRLHDSCVFTRLCFLQIAHDAHAARESPYASARRAAGRSSYGLVSARNKENGAISRSRRPAFLGFPSLGVILRRVVLR